MTYDEFKKILPELNNIKSFKGKIDFINQNLTRIGSGSGRVVYDIDGTKVLKLAKNEKGTAQNEAEADIGQYGDVHHIVAELIDSADDNSWIISEKAKKVNEKRIIELTGIPSLSELFYYLVNHRLEYTGKRPLTTQNPEIVELLDNNEFAHDLDEIISNYNLDARDFGKANSFGEVLHDGQPSIIITDYGLTDYVHQNYYSPARSGVKLYELYNFNDGNDDILSDIGNVSQEVRHGMWALTPYSVSDGDGVINEKFINFVENHKVYPQDLKGITVLNEEFHNLMNNVKEYVNHSKNKKRFYENLLLLQQHLVSKGLYNRDLLEQQSYSINEYDDPSVEGWSLDNEAYATELANAVAAPDKLNLGTPNLLGGGGNGFAYLVNGNKLLKITSDISEADAGLKINRGEPKTLAKVFGVWKLIDTEKNMAFYVLMEEYIQNKPIEEFRKYNRIIDTLAPNRDLEFGGIARKMKRNFIYDDWIERGKFILSSKPEADISEDDRKKTYNYFVGLVDIQKELLDYDIKSTDWSEAGNLGYKDGVLKFFDVGGYVTPEPQANKIYLPEDNQSLDEDYDIGTATNIANQIANNYKLNKPELIGNGLFGVAFDIGNNKVLKITNDWSEAVENSKLINKDLKHIAEPYSVFQVKSKSDSIPKTYAIILEKLQTSPEINRSNERLKYVFEKIMKLRIPDVVEHYLGYDENPNVNENKINAYLEKNPQDAKYFNELLEIAKECSEYDIKSMDFYNPQNLGYKKDGSLGFFDVGFGDGFSQPKNLEKVGVDEDAGSKFSTDNRVGQDGFPIYNNIDTSPSIDNNIPVNIDASLDEDLEYSHVDDATQDKYELDERIKSSMKGSSTFEVKDKCRLAGNGNTSTACNQGDINNLNIKPLSDNISEEIDASEAYSDEDMLQTMVDGKKDVGLIATKNHPEYIDIIHDNDFGILKIDQNRHNIDMNIVYRKNENGRIHAGRLLQIMKSKGGYVSDNTPDEAREIGKLLDYSDESIEKYVNRIYELKPDGSFRKRTRDEIIRNDRQPNKIPVVPEKDVNDYDLNETKYYRVDSGFNNKGRTAGDVIRFERNELGNVDDYAHIDDDKLAELDKYPAKNIIWVTKTYEDAKRYSNDENFSDIDELDLDGDIIAEDGDGGYLILVKPKNVSNIVENDIMNLQDLPFKEEIEQLGGKIFSVGGAVRDKFLGKESKDLDILITGVPFDNLEQLLSKYGKVDAVGKSFGILKFKPKGATEDIDIAIPRTEKATGEGGHKGFEVSSDHALPIEKDLERRDFTINAIAKDADGNLIDPYGGQQDLKDKIIRIVNPEAFSDDPLRMLRAVQFASRFGFTIEPNTMKMIIDNASRVKEIPPERILTEFDKIVNKGDIRTGVQLLKNTGLYDNIFGYELKQSTIDRSPFEEVKTMGEFIYLLTRLLPNPAEYFKNNLKGDIDSYKEIKALDFAFKNEVNNPIAARSVAHNMYLYSPQALQSDILPALIKTAAQELLSAKYPKGVNDLAVNGNDLMQIGLKGKEIGDAQKSLLLKIYADKVSNNREDLLNLAGNKKPIKEDMAKVLYSAVVLDDKSRSKVIQYFKNLIPEGWEILAHHMTINLGEMKPEYRDELGKKVLLYVKELAMDDKVMAVSVAGFHSMNQKPHITIAVNREVGGKPMMSNNLTNWERIKIPFTVGGVVTEVKNK